MQFYVKDIMSTDVVSIQSDSSIKDLIRTLSNYDVLGMPVLDSKGFVIGVVSSIDILKNESSHTFYYDQFMRNLELSMYDDASFLEQHVSTIMSQDLFTISPDATITQMAQIMYTKKIHRLLVTENKKLIGIVTTFDLLKLLASSDEEVVI